MSARAYRLHNKHTPDELVQMQRDIQNDPASKEGAVAPYIYNRKALRLLEDIGWAIYWHHAPKGNDRMQMAAPETKWW